MRPGIPREVAITTTSLKSCLGRTVRMAELVRRSRRSLLPRQVRRVRMPHQGLLRIHLSRLRLLETLSLELKA